MRLLKITIGILISAFFLWLALRGISPADLGTALAVVTPLPLAAACVLFLGAYSARGLRWAFMLHGVAPRPSYRRLISAIFIGAAANNVLPLRAGEFVRSFALKSTSGLSAGTSLSSIVLERVVDGLTLLAVLAVLMLSFPFPVWVFRLGIVSTAIFAGGTIFLAMLFTFRTGSQKIAGRLASIVNPAHAPPVAKFLGRLQDGLTLFSSWRALALTFIVSFLIWSLEAATYWCVGHSLGMTLGAEKILFCLVVVNFGLTLPSSPGFVGTFEYACVLSLGVFGVASAAAMAFALVLHAVFWAILVAAGIVFGWIDHGGFGKLAKSAGNNDKIQMTKSK